MNRRTTRLTPSILVAIALGALACSPALAEKKVLRLMLDGPVLESSNPDAAMMAALFGGGKPKSLREWIDDLRDAGEDGDIAGAALIIESPELGFAQAEELIRSIKQFRAKGKKVYAYADSLSNLTYALAGAADHITLAEYSEIDIVGLHAELSYYKGLLDKIGVEADMLHCGAYKSALEPFTRTEPSKEAAENVNWLLDGIFNRWIQLLADNRGQTVEQIRAAVDQAPLSAKQAISLKLVDAIGTYDEFRQALKKEFGDDVTIAKEYHADEAFELDTENPFALFQKIGEMLAPKDEAAKDGIGLIYITGPIMTGKNQASFMGGDTSAGSTTLRAAFNEAAEDDNVKAVVVRVDSPGGSALASDIMWKAAMRCAARKPIIVSMGNVAGSGGYYVALPGEAVFAEESTITGSIGVVGGKIVMKGLFTDKLGITTTEFDRGKNAGIMSTMRKWSEAERAKIETYMNDVYEQFKGRVKESRGSKIKGDLESLAGGRVYTGKQALERGLIDRIGGLQDALKYAASKAKLEDYEVYEFPKHKDFGDVLRELMGQPTEDEYEVSIVRPNVGHALFGVLQPVVEELAPQALRRVASGLQKLLILDREHVGMFMPLELNIR